MDTNEFIEIPNNCYECKIVPSCKALPRWGTKEMFEGYRHCRHANCSYNAFAEFLDKVSTRQSENICEAQIHTERLLIRGRSK